MNSFQLHHQRNVLIIEDEPQWQLLISNALKKIDGNIRLRTVKSVDQARRALVNGAEYDLIIADNFLEEGVTGLEFWKECKVHYSSIPFMIVSGTDENQLLSQVGTDIESPLFIAKPLHFDRFKKAVETCLTKSLESSFLKTFVLASVAVAISFGTALAMKQTPAVVVPKAPQVYVQSTLKLLKPVAKTHKKVAVLSIISPQIKAQVAEVVQRGNEIIELSKKQSEKISE